MPCESCAVQFSMFKRKRACCECERYYCSSCLRRGGGAMCAPCRVLSTRPLTRQAIAHLKVRDLQCFLQRQNVSTRGCVEKEELLSLCVSHVNSAAYRRRGSRAGPSPFSSLKGLTNNINDLINSAFDIRNVAHPAPPPPSRGCASNCFNTAHVHNDSGNDVPLNRPWPHGERFTTTPGGEPDILVPVPESSSVSRSTSAESARVDTADCFEIEDIDDTGWEFVNRPADPLPNDSDVLLSTSGSFARRPGPVERAASELDLRSPSPPLGRAQHDTGSLHDAQHGAPHLHDAQHGAPHLHDAQHGAPHLHDAQHGAPHLHDAQHGAPHLHDAQHGAPHLHDTQHDTASLYDTRHETASLDDAVLMDDTDNGSDDNGTPKHIRLEQFSRASELDALNVKQLKELLVRNRVEYRGCLERRDLLERAKTLWRNHAQYKDDIDNLPPEECCKICMAAPLECVLLECGHIAACTACAKQLAECPICRQYVVRAVRFFRS